MKQNLLILVVALSSIYGFGQVVAYPSFNDTSPIVTAQCIDLRFSDPVVIGHQLNVSVDYYETLQDAQDETNQLDRFYEFMGTPPQTIFARVDSDLDNSFDIAESVLDWFDDVCPCPPPPGLSPCDLEVCDADNDGSEIIYLNNLRCLYSGFPFPTASFCMSEDDDVETTYYLSESDAMNEANPVNPIYTLTETRNFFRKIKNVNTEESLIDDLITVSLVTCSLDSDSDGIPDLREDANRDLLIGNDDTDQDGLKNFEDDDDDGDGILTIDEDYNGNGDPTDDDTNGNSVPDYLESSVTLSVNEFNRNQIKLYPNPVSDILYFESIQNDSLAELSILNMLGTVVLTKRNFNLNESINISDFSSGIYFVRMETSKSIQILKFIKH